MAFSKKSYQSSIVLSILMGAQAILGLLFHAHYRDVAWIKATWYGNDGITLILVVPLFVFALITANRGSIRGVFLWLGGLGYAFYNYLYYLFGAALNVFFPLYVSTLVLSVIILLTFVHRVDIADLATHFRAKTPVRLIGGYLVFVGIGLGAVWLMMWAAYIFAGQPTPVETSAFQIVAAIDISLIASLLVFGGILLWRRAAWGYVVATMAGVLGSLYLVVLSVNSLVAIQLGTADAPGEIPIWGTLALLTAVATWLLLSNVQDER